MRILEASSHRFRTRAACEFLRGTAGGEALLVGPSRDAADELAIDAAGAASFGIHRFSPGQLVSHLAREMLAERELAPATALAVEAVATRVAHEARVAGELSRLAAVTGFPGFPRALGRTLAELRLDGVTPETIRARQGQDSELASLLERFVAALDQARLADRAILIELAIAHSATSPLRGLPLLLLDVPIGSRAEARLWGSLLRASSDALITVPRGDARTIEMLRAEGLVPEPWAQPAMEERSAIDRLQRRLFDANDGSDEPPPEPDDTVDVFSAPGEARECVEIARRILQSDAPFDRIAILLRSPEVYAHPLETALRRARIPAYSARGTRRPDPAGRAFLALLDCAVERLSARRFAEYLSFSQVPDDRDGAASSASKWVPPVDEALVSGPAQLSLFETARSSTEDAPATPAENASISRQSESWTESGARSGSLRAPWKWEEYLVDAAVIRGYERWERRIRGYRQELTLQIEQLLREDPDSPRLPGLERDRLHLGHLERFALPVVSILANWPREAIWGEWRESLSALAPRVLRKPDRVLAMLAELEPMSEVGPVTLAEVRDVLWNRLSLLETEPPPRRHGQVFVATPEQARGREFDLVFVPGLAERMFPRPPHEDPLLLDHVRAGLSDDLLRQDDRARHERLQLALAVGSASSRIVLSYPRIELSMARPRVPSFYCLEVARATRGQIPDLDLLERGAAERADARLAWPAPARPEFAIDDVEHDLSVLGSLLEASGEPDPDRVGHARYLFSLNPHLARSLRARYSRWRKRKWMPADGIVRRTEEIAPILDAHRLSARAYSVTALENFSVCPYRFLLAALHRIEPRADAAPLVRMDPLTRGSFIHEIQAILFRRLAERSQLPLQASMLPEAEATLEEIVHQVAARYADEVAPAIDRVWQDEVDAICADLEIWLRRMVDEPWTPAHFELSFGLETSLKQQRDPASIPDPVRLPDGWLLRGAVDLVERAGERIRVTDHKTGRNRTEVGTVTANGKVLQPVLYGLVVESMLGSPVEQSRLYFCTSRGGFSERIVHLDDRSRLYGSEAMQWIDAAVAAGQLPAYPEKDACGRCDFRTICGPHEEERVRRKPGQEQEWLRCVRELP